MASDITTVMMQNEELLRVVEEKSERVTQLRAIIAQTPAGYFRLDVEGHFLDVNGAWLRMHGYDSPDEVIGKHFSMMQVDSGSDSALAHIDELQHGGPVPFGVFKSRRKDGSAGHHTFSACSGANCVKNVGCEWFIVDISERIKLEEEKMAMKRQIFQARKLDGLAVLAGGIAHDFNNILMIITGYCGLTKLAYDTAAEHIPQIEKAVERAAELCRLMLAYAGKATLAETQVVMWALVEQVVHLQKETITRNVAINSHYSQNIPSIRGDAGQLREIVSNLISNASEAIGEAQGEITVSLTQTTIHPGLSEKDHLGTVIPAGGYVCLTVTDTGCGMDDEARLRMLEPFYSTKNTGRGLGMSSVLGNIKAHNGALQISSQPGSGTTCRVYLPARIRDAADNESIQQISPVRGATILLVEDEAELLLIMKMILQKLGFTVIEASNGKEALELYQDNAEDIALIMTDIEMPVMDGYALFGELKKLKPDLPIVIVSAFADTVITSKIPRDNIAGLINKPYNFRQLENVLKGIVGGA
jgi:PAS domain S-box-containing protein